MESSSNGNEIIERFTYPDSKQLSLFQKVVAYFKLAEIYNYPDFKLTQRGTSFDFSLHKDSKGQLHIELTYPLNGVLVNFTSTPDRTEFKVLLDGNASETEIHEDIESRIFNRKSDLQHVQSSKTAETEFHEDIESRIINRKSNLQHVQSSKTAKTKDHETTNTRNCIKKSYQQLFLSNIDDSNCQTLKIPPWLYNTFSDTEKGNANEDLSDVEYENPCYRDTPVILKSHSIRKFDIKEHSCVAESVTFIKENSFGQTDPLFMFYLKDVFYTPCALMRSNMVDGEIGISFKIFYIYETETELLMIYFTPIRKFSAFQIAHKILYRIDCRQVRNTTDFLDCLSPTDQENDWESVSKEKEEEANYTCGSYIDMKEIIERTQTQDAQFDQSESHKNIRPIENNKHEMIDMISKQIPYKNIDNCKNNFAGKNSDTKDFTHSKWVDRTKMGNHKLKTQLQRPAHAAWKITIIRGEDELVNRYLGNGMVRQAIYEFFGENDYIRYKASFERPNVPWPSMHPLLPYKYRFLDNRGSL